jgi:hypothetical protein
MDIFSLLIITLHSVLYQETQTYDIMSASASPVRLELGDIFAKLRMNILLLEAILSLYLKKKYLC